MRAPSYPAFSLQNNRLTCYLCFSSIEGSTLSEMSRKSWLAMGS